ncbi:phosphotransferase [Alphaproteobacteria bacterium GH1-50]|uniref:Phosphotransferase n=1 Tax=Kangsaoukella pontilimi TaxID=2691042 RepID=A0A7C9IKJ5_9RHOB|nr:aminoglycoside phosphotransferase family protein [Kangsaoukella pontilimi]MXQ09642.1 phosphotransferase [Kangsaoukella pontilimi]
MVRSGKEEILAGGNTNRVVRIGDTVRRGVTPHGKTIHEFLLHLEQKGIAAPRFKGIDGAGREILSFIEGDTGLPESLWNTDLALLQAAEMLRALHDASLDFAPSHPPSWASYEQDASLREVICHNDFAPYNLVFRSGVPVAVLDFDLCGPGPRCRDLAYLAYWMVPLSFSSADLRPISERDMRNGSIRLKRICAAYGGQAPGAVLQMVPAILQHLSDEESVGLMVGKDAADRLKERGHLEHWAREAAAFDAMSDGLFANLSD